jgi:AcrR family transcriptional regulator
MVSRRALQPDRAPRTKKDAVTRFRRATILDASCRAFARSGYEGTTVETIAAEAKIAKGTVYLYYQSKAEIYHAAVTHNLRRLQAETEKVLSESQGCRRKIEQFIRVRFDYVETHRDFYRIYLNEFGSALTLPPRLQKQLRKIYRQQSTLLESVIEEGVAKAEIRPVPAAATALAIYDLTRGLLQNRLLGWIDTGSTTDFEALMGLLWNGLRPAG